MPIPPTRYLDAGPGMPEASASAAMAPSLAMAQMGNTIAQVGQMGFQIAERVRKIDEAGKMSVLFANMEEDAAKFSLDLMRREDTEAWPGEWKERSKQWNDRAREAGLSPEAMGRFQNRFTEWNTQRSIGFEAMAANKSVELGQARVSNTVNYLVGRGQFDEAKREVQDWQEAGGMDSPAAQKAMMGIEQQQTEYELRQAVEDNPGEIVAADEKTLLEQYPNATQDMVRYAKQEAGKQEVKIATDIARGLEDQIYSDNPPTPDRLEDDPRFQQLKDGGHAKIAASLKQDLLARYDDGIQRQRATPQYQSLIMGKVAKDIANLNPNDGMAVYQAESLLRQMDAGPMKNHLAGELSRRISGEPADSTAMGMNLRLVDDAFKDGFFNAVKPEPPADVDKLVNEGFLKTANLKAAGLSEDQIESVLKDKDGKPRTNSAARFALQNVWKNRADKKAVENMDPFKAAVFDSIGSNKGTVEYKSDATRAKESAGQWNAASNYAKTKKQLLEWAKANPKKAEDIDTVRAELMRLIGPSRDAEFIDSAFGGADYGVLPGRDEALPEALDLPLFND